MKDYLKFNWGLYEGKKACITYLLSNKRGSWEKGFIWIVRTPEGNVIIDLVGKANGRGAYLKKDVAVIEAARKSHVLDKKLEVSVPDEIYDELKEVING